MMNKKQMPEWRKKNISFDNKLKAIIYFCVIVTSLVVIGIVSFTFIKGMSGLTPQFFLNEFDDKTVYADINMGEGLKEGDIKLVEGEDGTYAIASLGAKIEGIDAKGETYKLGKGDLIYSVDKKPITNMSVDEAEAFLTAQTGTVNAKVKIVGGGIKPLVIATLMMILLTLLFALPMGIGCAVYLSEYAKEGRLLASIRFAIQSLAGIPSIIYGLFGMLFFVTMLKFNYSLLAGALTVAIVILPTIISTTEEALKAVPKGLREGSLALGATQFQTIRNVVLPSAIPGILTAIVLSTGLIIGESAALILTAGTVARVPSSVFESAATITVKIYTVTKEQGNIEMAAAMGIVVIVVILVLNALTRSLQRLRKIK